MPNWYDTPPTSDELVSDWTQEPPKPDELEASIPDEGEVSQTEAALRGVAQGLTFGGAPLIAGGYEALMSRFGDDKRSLSEAFKEGRLESAKKFREAREAHPGTSMTGEIGGAILPLLLTMGGSGAVSAASATARGAEAIPLLTRIGKAAKTGATIGATQGAISEVAQSEKEGGTLGEATEGALKGGVAGGLLAGGITGLIGGTGKLISAGKNLAKQTAYGRDIAETYDIAKTTGKAITGSVDELQKFGADAESLAQNLSKLTKGEGSKLHKEINDEITKLYNEASEKGITADISRRLQQAKDKIAKIQPIDDSTATAKKDLLEMLDRKLLGEGKVQERLEMMPITERRTVIGDEQQFQDAVERLKAKKKIEGIDPSDITGRIEEIPSAEGKQKVGIIIQKTRDAEGNLTGEKAITSPKVLALADEPEYAPKLVKETVREGGTPVASTSEQATFGQKLEPFATKEDFEIRKAAQDLRKGIRETINESIRSQDTGLANRLEQANAKLKTLDPGKMTDDGLSSQTPSWSDIIAKDDITDTGIKAKNKIDSYLDKLSQIDDPLSKSLRKQIDSKAQMYRLSKRAAGGQTFGTSGGVIERTVLGPAFAQPVRVAGQIGKYVGKYDAPAANIWSKVKSIPFEGYAKAIENSPMALTDKGQKLLQILRNGTSRDQIGKNAMLFSLMQDPDYREMLSSVGEE